MFAAIDWLVTSLSAAGTLLAFAVIGRMGGTSWFPHLPEPDPDQPPSRSDRVRYYAANLLAILIGTGAAILLAEGTQLAAVPYRYTPFDGAGRWLGAGFFGLGMGAYVAMMLIDRMVAPGPLLHILWHSGRRFGAGLDFRPGTRRLGLLVAVAALALHFGIRRSHTTLDEVGVQWRDYPWQQDLSAPWSDLRDVRIVQTFTAMTGRVRQRPHLGLEFQDGTVLHLGRGDTRPIEVWERAAAFAAQRSGLTVRRVESDE